MITVEHAVSLPDTYPLERLGPLEKLLFFDIETTGFSGDYSMAYLIGCTYYRQNKWHLIQWFADTASAESDLLTAFFQFLEQFSILVHFNGDGFDIPYLLKRCKAHNLPYDFSGVTSIDIYKKIRPYRKILGLESLKQKSIERFLGIFRQDPYSGGQLIEVYQDYLNSHHAPLYDMLMLHNKEDLEGMPLILPILFYSDFFEQEFTLSDQNIVTQPDLFGQETYYLCLTLKNPVRLPAAIQWTTDRAVCEADENTLTLTVELCHDTLKHYYPNYKDYYYLIYEDTAIHKSIGEYVDKEARKKATAQTCYVKKEASFLPQPDILWEPVFKKEYREKKLYAEYEPDMFGNHDILSRYIKYLLHME